MNPRALCCALLVCALLVPTSAVAATGIAVGGGEAGAALAQEGASNNSSVQHRDPDAVREEGNAEELRRWLVGRMAERLGEGAVQLNEGEYDRARRLVGDQYSERLDQLVDVEGETETTRTLRETRESQRETADSLQKYRETYEEYREARRNGNNERARELGRELERQSQRVNRNAGETNEGYDELGNRTGREFTEPQEAIENVSENVSETQAEVREDLFVETELTVSADGEAVSFTDPLAISGTVTTENDTAVADQPIRLRVGGRTLAAETDGAGRFEVDYRPVTLPANATNATVEFRPANESEYLSSSATLPVAVETVEPDVTVAREPSRVAYNETLTASGRVSADGVGAPAPVAVYVGDRRVARTNASANGTYSATARLPADVADGERTVRAVVDQDGRAIERTGATNAVTVASTPTDLSARAERGNATVRIAGRLTTAEGEGLAERTVRVERDGTALGSVTTNATGWYEATLSVPEAAAGETVEVTTTFPGTGTNLERASASAAVALPEGWAGAGSDTGAPAGPREIGLLEWLSGVFNGEVDDSTALRQFVVAYPLPVASFVLGIVVLSAAGGYAVLTGRGLFGSDDGGSVEERTGTRPDDASEPTGTDDESARAVASLLERAREQVTGGAVDAGIVTAYAAVRRGLTDRGGAGEGHTHWEFYRQSRDALDEESARVLRELTEAYERAAFAPDSTSVDRARDLLERVARAAEDTESAAD